MPTHPDGLVEKDGVLGLRVASDAKGQRYLQRIGSICSQEVGSHFHLWLDQQPLDRLNKRRRPVRRWPVLAANNPG